MKKTIITTSIIIVVIIAAVFGYQYISSFYKVSVALHKGVEGATLYKVNPDDGHVDPDELSGTELEKISGNKTVSLQKGEYYLVASGPNLSKDPIHFSVINKPVAVEVDPDYSSEFLAQQLAVEAPAITSAMIAQYPLISSDYTVTNGTLYQKGTWYGALLTKKVSDPRDQQDYYRVVMHKENEKWKVINKPELILTTTDFKDVPIEVLRAINKLSV